MTTASTKMRKKRREAWTSIDRQSFKSVNRRSSSRTYQKSYKEMLQRQEIN